MSYVGKPTVIDYDPGSGHCEKDVPKLMVSYLDKGHDLYMDNFYKSELVSLQLHESRTHTVGRPRAIRKQKNQLRS